MKILQRDHGPLYRLDVLIGVGLRRGILKRKGPERKDRSRRVDSWDTVTLRFGWPGYVWKREFRRNHRIRIEPGPQMKLPEEAKTNG